MQINSTYGEKSVPPERGGLLIFGEAGSVWGHEKGAANFLSGSNLFPRINMLLYLRQDPLRPPRFPTERKKRANADHWSQVPEIKREDSELKNPTEYHTPLSAARENLHPPLLYN